MLPAYAACLPVGEPRAEPASIAGALFDPVRGVYRGSGVLVSSCHVLTNHHVAFTGAPVAGQRLAFLSAPDAHGRRRGAVTGSVVAWNPDFWPERRFHQDWALIVLDHPVNGDPHAELPDEALSPRAVGHLVRENGVVSLGYVFPSPTVGGAVPRLKREACSLRAHGPTRYTNCTIVPGNSGGPLLRELDGRQIVVGLNVAWRIESGGAVAAGESDLARWNPVVPLDPLSGNVSAVRRAMAQHACSGTRAAARTVTGA
jgi:hypothetical protein